MPCKGVYADVVKDMDIINVRELRKFDKLVKNYENYKRDFVDDINYPEQVKGKKERKGKCK